MTGEQNNVNFVNSVPGPWPLFLLPVSRCLARPAIFSGSAAPLSRGAAPLVAPRSSLLVAAASSSPLASLRRWASLRLCDAALNADPHPVLMDAGLLALFLSLLPLPFLLAATLLSHFIAAPLRLPSSPPLHALQHHSSLSLFYAVRLLVRLFSLRHRSCLCHSCLRSCVLVRSSLSLPARYAHARVLTDSACACGCVRLC